MILRRILLVSLFVTGISVPAASLLNACPPDPNNLPPGSGYLEPGQKKCVTDPDKGTICGTFPKGIAGPFVSPLKNRDKGTILSTYPKRVYGRGLSPVKKSNVADRFSRANLSLHQSRQTPARHHGKLAKASGKTRISARLPRHAQTGTRPRISRR